MSVRARLASIVASAALALVPFPARAQGVEPERLASEAAAVVPVDVETRLVVSLIPGEVVLQAGKPGELRFHSRKKGTAKEELPVELWLDRGRFVDRDVGELSGGWKMRPALARILLMKPDALLLDEPTNHLDIESILWLEQFLHDFEGALIMT